MNGNPNEPIAIPTPQPSKKNRNFVIVFILLLLIGGFLTLSILLQLKKPATKLPSASLSDTTLIATVNGQEVFLGDVKNVAREQYLESAINNQALKIALDTLIERMLLDIEAKKYGVTVTDQELQEVIGNESSQLATIKRYELLKAKIIQRIVATREAFTIGFFIIPLDKPQIPLYEEQRSDGKKALTEIEERLRKGEEPLAVARSIYDKYPSLQTILAVNGYILRSTQDNDTVISTPKVYTYDDDKIGQFVQEAVFSMKKNEIRKIIGERGSGGTVVQVVKVNTSGSKNYEDWFNEKMKQLVKIVHKL